ncbi:MAG: hypothetical protein NTV49_05720 [Kiritimatiellaeota bacterium]|nr:hypothetical protein [Kiritimatiellota bacterium]
MKKLNGWLGVASLAAVVLTGCGTTKPKDIRLLSDQQLRTFFEQRQDPRRYEITLYDSEDGVVFVGTSRLRPDQQAVLPFASGSGNRAPVVSLGAGRADTFPVLLDTSSRDNWLRFEKAVEVQAIPLGTVRAFDMMPKHVREDVPGYACRLDPLVFDTLRMDNVLFYVRSASGPLGVLGRRAEHPAPEAVLGCDTLKAFAFVQFDYPLRLATFSATFGYTPKPSRLVAELPLNEVEGVWAVDGLVDGQPGPILLDSAGDFELSVAKAAGHPLKQVSIGDLVFRQVRAVSSRDQGLEPQKYPRLGRQLLARYKVTFDNLHSMVYFERPDNP